MGAVEFVPEYTEKLAEIVTKAFNEVNGTNYTKFTTEDLNRMGSFVIRRMFVLIAKQIQEEQIKICAYEYAEGTIAQGGEHELIADVKRVIE